MKIFAVGITDKKSKYIGDSNTIPVPRIGERIFVGYNPPPTITDVVYILHEDMIIIVVDGLVLDETPL